MARGRRRRGRSPAQDDPPTAHPGRRLGRL